MRVSTYSRVSTTHDQKPQIQTEELRRYCNARGWTIVREIVDHGFSGSTDARPGLRELLRMARSREIDAVVCLKLDRLFRSLKHLINTLEELESLNVKFVAVKDSIDYTTPSGRLFVQVLGSLAEFEKSLMIERTMMGLAHARANGKVLGRPKVRNDQAILELRSRGLSYTEIQRALNISRGAVSRALKASRSKSPSKSNEKPKGETS